MRRVVVTGLGMVSPLGCGVEPTWKRILDGMSGAKQIETFDVADLPCRIACVVPRGDGTDGTFNPVGLIAAGEFPAPANSMRPSLGFIIECGETVDLRPSHVNWRGAA